MGNILEGVNRMLIERQLLALRNEVDRVESLSSLLVARTVPCIHDDTDHAEVLRLLASNLNHTAFLIDYSRAQFME